MLTTEKEFRFNGRSITLEVSPDYLFMPNAVTGLFAKVVKINEGNIVFDIGSGVGPLAIWSALELSKEVHAVEIVKAQHELLVRNVKSLGLQNKIRSYHGEFFEPIPKGIKADVIIADVSGIANGPARALGWYPKEIPTGGGDGTEVIIPLLNRAPPYLAEGGRLYFPVAIDLSDSEKTMAVARANFGSLERVAQANFTLDEGQVKALEPFSHLPYVTPQSKGSRTIWRGEIYEATDPIHH